jgi:hypothetical protein
MDRLRWSHGILGTAGAVGVVATGGLNTVSAVVGLMVLAFTYCLYRWTGAMPLTADFQAEVTEEP